MERMSFLNEGWKGVNNLKVNDYVNVKVFELNKGIHVDNYIELELSGLKHMKSLRVQTTRMGVKVEGLSLLSNVGFLEWSTHGCSPCLEGIGCLTRLRFLRLSHCKDMEELDLSELKLLQVV